MSTDPAMDALFGATPTPAPAQPRSAPNQGPQFSDDADAAIRTAMGEDSSNPAAIAAVMYNRAKASGKTLSQVALEPGQFEAWSSPKNAQKLMAIDAGSPAYQKAAAAIAPVLAGQADPTNGADSYYNPTLQASDGRPAPAWDDGTGQKIGQQLYFKGKYGAAPSGGGDAAMDALFGTGPAKSSSAEPSAAPAQPAADAARAPNEIYDPTGKTQYTPEQVKTIQQMVAAGKFDTANGAYLTHGGEANTPYMQGPDGAVPTTPGTYYIDRKGAVQQTEGKPVSAGEGATQGGIQGLKDVGNSVANLDDVNPAFEAALAKTNPLAAQNAARQDQNHTQQAVENKLYDARYGGNGYALGGRIAGNIVGSAPVMALAPEAGIIDDAGAAGNIAGQIGKFALGGAGKGGNMLVRAGSLAARGAGEGATATALTSSTSDQPLGNQLLGGAVAGGILSPAAKVAGALAKSGASATGEFGSSVARLFGEPENKLLTPQQTAAAQKQALAYVNNLVQHAPENALATNAAEAAGKPITAAEALGRTASNQLGITARRSGDAGDVVESFMRQRQQAMPDRVLQDFSTATGLDPSAISGDFSKQAADLRAAAKPAYDKAYAAGGIISPTLDALSSRPAMQAAMQRAMGIAAEEGRTPSELGFTVKDVPNAPTTETRTVTQAVPGGGTRDVQVQAPVTGGSTSQMIQVQNPTAQTWDYVKRGLDDVINSNRNPLTGKLILDEKGRAQLGTLNSLRSELVNLNPAYGDALSAGGEPLRLEDAYGSAPKMMANNVPMPTFSQKFDALSPSEQQAHTAGVVNDVFNKVAAGKVSLRDLKTPLYQQKLTAMLGPDKASAFANSIDQELSLSRTGGRINPNGGSPTVELNEANKDQDATMRTLTGAAGKAAKGDFLGAAAHALTDPFLGAVRGAQQPLSPAARSEVANLLLMKPSELKNKLTSIGNAKNPDFGYRGVIARQLVPTAVIGGNRLIGNAQ